MRHNHTQHATYGLLVVRTAVRELRLVHTSMSERLRPSAGGEWLAAHPEVGLDDQELVEAFEHAFESIAFAAGGSKLHMIGFHDVGSRETAYAMVKEAKYDVLRRWSQANAVRGSRVRLDRLRSAFTDAMR